MILVGQTGSGKSYFLNNILEDLIQENDTDITYLDGKLVESQMYKNRVVYVNDDLEVTKFIKVLENILSSIKRVLENDVKARDNLIILEEVEKEICDFKISECNIIDMKIISKQSVESISQTTNYMKDIMTYLCNTEVTQEDVNLFIEDLCIVVPESKRESYGSYPDTQVYNYYIENKTEMKKIIIDFYNNLHKTDVKKDLKGVSVNEIIRVLERTKTHLEINEVTYGDEHGSGKSLESMIENREMSLEYRNIVGILNRLKKS